MISRRVPIPLFGAGLVEAIPDEALLALDDAGDRDRDGISGRAAVITDIGTGQRRVGRFGWKAQHATLLAFGADAYRNEMGITNDLFPDELAFGITTGADEAVRPDPGSRGSAGSPDAAPGHRQFRVVHEVPGAGRARPDRRHRSRGRGGLRRRRLRVVPSCRRSRRAPVANAVFNRKVVPLFSDLLLHDIGTGDGIRQEAATPQEFRTPALWGLRLRRPLLHDGTAATIEDAIGRARRRGGIRASAGFWRSRPISARRCWRF